MGGEVNKVRLEFIWNFFSILFSSFFLLHFQTLDYNDEINIWNTSGWTLSISLLSLGGAASRLLAATSAAGGAFAVVAAFA